MLGAILGDIIGSPYEHRMVRPMKSKDFPLFGKRCHFTDDTVTTIAVAEALMIGKRDRHGYVTPLRDRLQYWCRQYPNVGFGGLFRKWFMKDHAAPYGSFGNGAAMRVAPAGWVGENLDEAQELAELTAVVSHDHPQAIIGAIAVASAIYLARVGTSKEEIRSYIQDHFYPLDKSVDDIRPTYSFICDTEHSVPEAITCFLESESFEDAIRNAVSLGGDTDTQAAMAGAMAEAYYGIPKELAVTGWNYLPDGMRRVVQDFHDQYMTEPKDGEDI